MRSSTRIFYILDLEIFYNSNVLDPERNVRTLQAKVMWDIRYYFARRGTENIHKMTKDTFMLSTNPETGVKFIHKVVDEETKNHKEVDGQIVTAFMPEMGYDNKKCPVQSNLTYLYSLRNDSNKLWQSPKFTDFPEDPRVRVWYGPNSCGHNTHEKFVSKLAKNCGLESFGYTNHSLRVSAINVLTRQNYTNKQIMSITSHKSSTSLETYQRVSNHEKLRMGSSLGGALVTSNALVPYNTNTTSPVVAPISNNIENTREIVPIEANITPNTIASDDIQLSDQEIMKFIQQTESDQQLMMSQSTSREVTTTDGCSKTVSTNMVTKKSSQQIPAFYNCTFNGNLTININK